MITLLRPLQQEQDDQRYQDELVLWWKGLPGMTRKQLSNHPFQGELEAEIVRIAKIVSATYDWQGHREMRGSPLLSRQINKWLKSHGHHVRVIEQRFWDDDPSQRNSCYWPYWPEKS